jgi:hypothetical protein
MEQQEPRRQHGLGDPEARLGRGRKGFYLGYRAVFLTDVEGFPLGHVEAPANVNEPLLVVPLLDRVLGEDLELELLAVDSGFESRRVFEVVEARKVTPLVARRRMRVGRARPMFSRSGIASASRDRSTSASSIRGWGPWSRVSSAG